MRRIGPVLLSLLLVAPAVTTVAPAEAARGERLVFSVSHRSGALGLASMRPNGDDRRPLTDEPDSEPEFSPDGRMVAFVRQAGPALDLYVANANGRNARALIRQRSTSDPLCQTFDWAPDSTRLIVVAETESRDGCDLFVVGLDGTITRLLEREGVEWAPSWSPSGSEVAFMGDDPAERTFDIYSVPAEGGEPLRLTSDPESDFGPEWSPDGERIAFSTDRDDCCGTEFGASNFELYVMDRDGSDQVRVTASEDISELSPRWSPFGEWIAYYTDAICSEPPGCGDAEDIWKVRPDGSDATRLTHSRHAREFSPVWAPSGRWVAFVRQRGGRDDLAKAHASGGGTIRLTRTRRIDEVSPDWH